MTAGSAAQVLLAFGDGDLPEDAAFSARVLAEVRRRGWAHSVGEREQGVASVSAPVLAGGSLVAAVSVSGPIERLTRQPGRLHAPAVLAAARELSR
jgi:DNA-binding IclR family transcriptional regulator